MNAETIILRVLNSLPVNVDYTLSLKGDSFVKKETASVISDDAIIELIDEAIGEYIKEHPEEFVTHGRRLVVRCECIDALAQKDKEFSSSERIVVISRHVLHDIPPTVDVINPTELGYHDAYLNAVALEPDRIFIRF